MTIEHTNSKHSGLKIIIALFSQFRIQMAFYLEILHVEWSQRLISYNTYTGLEDLR
jgi:hypothetical protein